MKIREMNKKKYIQTIVMIIVVLQAINMIIFLNVLVLAQDQHISLMIYSNV